METSEKLRGRGAQSNPHNPFLKQESVREHFEGIDEEALENTGTEYLPEFPKKVVNRVDSPDIGLGWSLNPYQGCEHGCLYCYARPTHQYWGYSAGLDFERKILIKENAPELLIKKLNHPNWEARPIMLSGNTDCYQPIERKKKLTRRILEILLEFRHPVGIITKNSLVLRDLDLLTELNRYNLVHVNLSITTLDEDLRRHLEPRTASAKQRLKAVRVLSDHDIPVNVMMAPLIPGLTSHEIPQLLKAAADAGASSAAYTMARLNGPVADLFEEWIRETYPDKADKVLHQIAACHGGQLGDSRFGLRMSGEGKEAEAISRLFKLSREKYFHGRSMRPIESHHFLPRTGKQLELF